MYTSIYGIHTLKFKVDLMVKPICAQMWFTQTMTIVEFFKGGIQNYKGFWLKINCSQMKLPKFDNWSDGELSKIGHHFRK